MSPDEVEYVKQQTLKGIEVPEGQLFEPENCFACHMPQRRTRDVVKVTMTDHLITRKPGGEALLSPLEEAEPVITELGFYERTQAPGGDEGEIYRVIALLRQYPTVDAVNYLEKLLKRSPTASAVPYSDLAIGLLKAGRKLEAVDVIRKHLIPVNYPEAEERLGAALVVSGQVDEGIDLLRKAVETRPENAASWFNMGLAYLEKGHSEAAEEVLRKALSLEPIMDKGWYYLGVSLQQQDKSDEAIEAFRQSLAVNPVYTAAYVDIVKTLVSSGRKDEARRYLIQGKKTAHSPKELESLRLE
jgi:tetratricopeptide (TPR) repeat protein